MLATMNRPAANLPVVLSEDQLRYLVPSAFAETPWHAMSGRYGFVPTSTIIGRLAGEGFYPVKAFQSGSRVEGKEEYTRHLIRFRHLDYLASAAHAEVPELVLVNSHDGTSAYQLAAGIYRMVCKNGLIVRSANLGTLSVKHSGGDDFADRIIEATYTVMGTTKLAVDQIEQWKSISLTAPQRLALATAATELRPNGLEPARLLTTRRMEDRASSDLWTTTNVIQENFIAGGLYGHNPDTGRRFKTRPIKSVGEDLRLNKSLWTLTEKMAELLG